MISENWHEMGVALEDGRCGLGNPTIRKQKICHQDQLDTSFGKKYGTSGNSDMLT